MTKRIFHLGTRNCNLVRYTFYFLCHMSLLLPKFNISRYALYTCHSMSHNLEINDELYAFLVTWTLRSSQKIIWPKTSIVGTSKGTRFFTFFCLFIIFIFFAIAWTGWTSQKIKRPDTAAIRTGEAAFFFTCFAIFVIDESSFVAWALGAAHHIIWPYTTIIRTWKTAGIVADFSFLVVNAFRMVTATFWISHKIIWPITFIRWTFEGTLFVINGNINCKSGCYFCSGRRCRSSGSWVYLWRHTLCFYWWCWILTGKCINDAGPNEKPNNKDSNFYSNRWLCFFFFISLNIFIYF